MAALAAVLSGISTKPKPRERLVSRSVVRAHRDRRRLRCYGQTPEHTVGPGSQVRFELIATHTPKDHVECSCTGDVVDEAEGLADGHPPRPASRSGQPSRLPLGESCHHQVECFQHLARLHGGSLLPNASALVLQRSIPVEPCTASARGRRSDNAIVLNGSSLPALCKCSTAVTAQGLEGVPAIAQGDQRKARPGCCLLSEAMRFLHRLGGNRYC